MPQGYGNEQDNIEGMEQWFQKPPTLEENMEELPDWMQNEGDPRSPYYDSGDEDTWGNQNTYDEAHYIGIDFDQNPDAMRFEGPSRWPYLADSDPDNINMVNTDYSEEELMNMMQSFDPAEEYLGGPMPGKEGWEYGGK
jgi:hypothetical protein